MILGTGVVMLLLVPESAQDVFGSPWLLAALAQPINALSFVTDGILWGGRDYRFLRNVMFVASAAGFLLLARIDLNTPDALTQIWVVSAVFISVRAVFGIARIWPGIGASPFRETGG